jgi:hypothetical protein
MDWLDETVFGEHLDQDNVFRWDVVELNLPVCQAIVLQNPGFTRSDQVMEDSLLVFYLTLMMPVPLDPVMKSADRQLESTPAPAITVEFKIPPGSTALPP